MSCEKECGKTQILDEEQIIALQEQQMIAANTKYVETIKMLKRAIVKEDPKDRLDYANAILSLILALNNSLKGWQSWLNLRSMNILTLKEMKENYPKMKELVEKWLQIDIDITETKTKEIEKQHKARVKASKKAKKKAKKPYIS